MTLKRLLIIGMMFLCMVALPVMAQDAESTAPAAEQAGGGSGITTLVILSGLAGVVVVGGLIYRRENANGGREVD